MRRFVVIVGHEKSELFGDGLADIFAARLDFANRFDQFSRRALFGDVAARAGFQSANRKLFFGVHTNTLFK